MSAPPDAGMLAIRRVREVREQDGRVGLQRALVELRAAQDRVDLLWQRLAAAREFDGPVLDFLAERDSLARLGRACRQADEERDRAAAISESAYSHWQRQRTELAAVELLLERRAQARREETARREAAELDEIARQRWARRVRGGAA